MANNCRRILVGTLFCVLAFTASASAECAWVLWTARTSPPNTTKEVDWQHEGAWPSATPCFKEISLQKRIAEDANKRGNTIHINEHGARGLIHNFRPPGR